MNILFDLSTLALGQIVGATSASLKQKLGDGMVNSISSFLGSRFTDHSQKLTGALQDANKRTWKVLEIALDDSVWSKWITTIGVSAEDRAFAETVRAFLANKPAFCKAVLSELQAARKVDLLTSGTLDPAQLACQSASFVRFTDQVGLLAAEYKFMEDIGKELESHGYKQLGWLVQQRPENDISLGGIAVRYFFRRAVEEDQQLYQGLAFELLQALLGDVRAIMVLLRQLRSQGALLGAWDGITQVETLRVTCGEAEVKERLRLADGARNSNWELVLDIISKFPKLVNSCRPGSTHYYSPLHQAAENGAPPRVAKWLIEKGAWRTLPNVHGERPLEVAVRRGRTPLLALLKPQYRWHVPIQVLHKIQAHFHGVIMGRVANLASNPLRLPELEPLLELETPWMWFWVPSMNGGFSYCLVGSGEEAKLISVSCGRGVGGSGQCHEISFAGSEFLEDASV